MTTDDIVLWTAFITGIIASAVATASFVWQLIQWRAAKKGQSISPLNNRVLRPWSNIAVVELYDPPNEIDFRVPKSALPADLAPSIPENGWDFPQIPGARTALDYIEKNHGYVARAWYKAADAHSHYEGSLHERHRLLETMVTEGMAAAYPNLNVWTSGEQRFNSYSIPATIKVVEAKSYQQAAHGILNVQVTQSQMDLGGETRYDLGEQSYSPLFTHVHESDADVKKLSNLLQRWICSDKVQELSLKMVKQRAELDEAMEDFRAKLRAVCLEIEQTGG